MVVLFDNCTPELSKPLTTRMERECEKRGIIAKNTLVVMICLYSSFSFKIQDPDPQDVENRTKKPFSIDRKLSPKEKERFEQKLRELEKEFKGRVEDMLSFVIMAQARLKTCTNGNQKT